ncbi:hypothetical protein KY345_06865 [Candidatus Woesearchaeota archaeon]|nr:hypothetical protein [Candidatus Woesearchaeota archaeon]
MVHVAECIGIGAQYYNLAFAVIVIFLYIGLLRLPPGKVFMKPWKYIFLSLCIYIVEQIISILNTIGWITAHPLVFPIFEFIIITIFIYTLLTLREHIKGGVSEKTR